MVRADFYIGMGEKAVWLGSIAVTGDPENIPPTILKEELEKDFRKSVGMFIKNRSDGTKPEQGFPWPWRDSKSTDYSYAFKDGKVYASHYGSNWFDPLRPFSDMDEINDEKVEFPDMKHIQNVDFGHRSGLYSLIKAE